MRSTHLRGTSPNHAPPLLYWLLLILTLAAKATQTALPPSTHQDVTVPVLPTPPPQSSSVICNLMGGKWKPPFRDVSSKNSQDTSRGPDSEPSVSETVEGIPALFSEPHHLAQLAKRRRLPNGSAFFLNAAKYSTILTYCTHAHHLNNSIHNFTSCLHGQNGKCNHVCIQPFHLF